MLTDNRPACTQKGECFAKSTTIYGGTLCSILTETYHNGKPCPFQKKNREITNGVSYPYNPK